MRGRDSVEVRIDHVNHMDATRVSVGSRMYDFHMAYQLRAMWGDPRQLAEFVDRLVGNALRQWEGLRVRDGRAMAQALMPFWEREIHAFMERMEHENRRHRAPRYDDRIDALRYAFLDPHGFGPPPEDPKAKKKARELLLKNLDSVQAEAFKKDGAFAVTARDGMVYTIKTARSFNVVGPDGAKYCGQLADTSIEDQMLAQKLLLEHEPDKFFKNANVSPAPGSARETATENIMRMEYMNSPRYVCMDWGR